MLTNPEKKNHNSKPKWCLQWKRKLLFLKKAQRKALSTQLANTEKRRQKGSRTLIKEPLTKKRSFSLTCGICLQQMAKDYFPQSKENLKSSVWKGPPKAKKVGFLKTQINRWYWKFTILHIKRKSKRLSKLPRKNKNHTWTGIIHALGSTSVC